MQKLHLALDVYRGLGSIPATRVDTLTKVSSMLLHPFPKVLVVLSISRSLTLTVVIDPDHRGRDVVDVDARGEPEAAGLEFTIQKLEASCRQYQKASD